MDKQREMFEAEFHLFDLRTEQDEDGDLMYIDDLTQGAWLGWKAAIAAQQSEPRCACGDSFTSDAVCANCLAAEWEPTK